MVNAPAAVRRSSAICPPQPRAFPISAQEFDEEKICRAALSFIGKQEQIPPMYSAIKVNGKKLFLVNIENAVQNAPSFFQTLGTLSPIPCKGFQPLTLLLQNYVLQEIIL